MAGGRKKKRQPIGRPRGGKICSRTSARNINRQKNQKRRGAKKKTNKCEESRRKRTKGPLQGLQKQRFTETKKTTREKTRTAGSKKKGKRCRKKETRGVRPLKHRKGGGAFGWGRKGTRNRFRKSQNTNGTTGCEKKEKGKRNQQERIQVQGGGGTKWGKPVDWVSRRGGGAFQKRGWGKKNK